MILGGLQKFSLLDFPGHIAAIIFTQGCNFRCQFCYNPMLVWPALGHSKFKYEVPSDVWDQKDHQLIEEGDLFVFLKSRLNKLDGLVITGGEPTMHADLPEFIGKIKTMGFKIKLDTNGTNPEMIKILIESKLIDYIAMDIKGPEDKYEKITGVKIGLDNIKKSIKIIMGSNLPYEFRTTVVPGLLEKNDIKKMGEMIRGADKWFLQPFKSDTDLINPDLEGKFGFKLLELDEMRKIGKEYVQKCEIR